MGAHNSVVGADQGFRAPSWDQESVHDAVHEDSASARIATGQRPRPSFRHPQDIAVLHDALVRVDEAPHEGVFVGVDPDHSHDLGLSVVAVAVAEWPSGAQTCVKAPRGSSF